MKVFISADMEGISGIADARDVVKGQADYIDGQDLFLGDVEAAVEGARAAGADEILVNDSHTTMTNLPAARMPDGVRLCRGSTKHRTMMTGVEDDDVGVAFFVGYHAMAGTPNAILNHTFFVHEVHRTFVNEVEVGEIGLNVGFAHHFDVPVGLITGDDKTAIESTELLGDVETAVVKHGIDRFSGEFLPLDEARGRIREGATRAVERAMDGDFDQFEFDPPFTLGVEWATTNQAYQAAQIPCVDRVDGRTTTVSADTYPVAYDAAAAMLRTGYAGTNEWYG